MEAPPLRMRAHLARPERTHHTHHHETPRRSPQVRKEASVSSQIIHQEQHPQSGETVTYRPAGFDQEHQYIIEDWWDRLAGMSWMFTIGNPACINYAAHAREANLPIESDDVVYGHVDGLGYLAHISELHTQTPDDTTAVRILVSPRRPEKTRALVDQLLDQATDRGIRVEIFETGTDHLADEKISRARADVEARHQFLGETCTCGTFTSAHSQTRTEHITTALAFALRARR